MANSREGIDEGDNERGCGMIVTIDGPAGAGKSSVARRLAEELGFHFLDTGAMYRCVTLACLQRQIALEDTESVATIAENVQIERVGDRVLLDGVDVTQDIRKPLIAQSIKSIADNLAVRRAMVELQRRWCQHRDAVTEGRDQGTVAFPDAECKIFLTASSEERARRRLNQLLDAGIDADLDEILRMQNERDENDMRRAAGGLRAAEDAVTVFTDGLSEQAVLARLIELVRSRM